MKPTNPVQSMPVYASDSAYRKGPSDEQQLAGMVPLDTLPADWWNWLWEQVTIRINSTVSGLESVYDEILSVLADAEIAPSDLQVNQLLTAIKAITQRVGSSGTAGAVKSSSDSGKVAIDANGFMSPNGMGIPSSLNTTAKSIVSAINELLAALNAYKTSNDGAVTVLENSLNEFKEDTAETVQGITNAKAPNNHASPQKTYGLGNVTNYGHVKVSDTYSTQIGAAADGVAASQKALYDMYTKLTSGGVVTLGNTNGCALGTASAGSCGTAARSDHVHPLPNCVANAGYATSAGSASTATIASCAYCLKASASFRPYAYRNCYSYTIAGMSFQDISSQCAGCCVMCVNAGTGVLMCTNPSWNSGAVCMCLARPGNVICYGCSSSSSCCACTCVYVFPFCR